MGESQENENENDKYYYKTAHSTLKKYSGYSVSIVSFIVISYWTLVQLHAHFCTPYNIWGFITTFFNMGSPVCFAMVTLMNKMIEMYSTFWVAAAIGISGWFIGILGIVSKRFGLT
jgi:hypothetical protein